MVKKSLAALAAVAALAAATSAAQAAYPEKDITFIIPHAPGGTFDTYVRAIAPALERHLPNKVNVLPTNMPGANQAKAIGTMYKAKPDGYTIAIFDIPGGLLPQIAGNPPPPYDLTKFTWLASVGSDHYGLAVNGTSPIKSLEDMKKLGRPVKLTATGAGTTSYMVAQIATDILGIPSSIVSGYRSSSEYVIGAIRGDGDGTVAVVPMLHKYRDSGDLRTVAVLAPKSPIAGAPDANQLGHPELASLSIRRLLGAPPGLPENIRAILEKALLDAMKDPETVKIMAAAGAEMQPENGAAAAEILKASFEFFTRYRKYLPQQ